ncbi:MAG: aconitase/3-isopropylmalate dehydratase large subunit family protein [Methanomicrobiales archaeon]|nr:aconitase/3-isopropylmalate dehydratase large subunit family protein [Methanomicrobiales archaeon]
MSSLSERILAGAEGSYVDREVDRAYVHDGTGVLTLEVWKAMGSPPLRYPERVSIFFDHIAPANNSTTSTLQRELRIFATERGLNFSDVGGGISHQLMAERGVLPGEIVVGADSHTCTLGAFGAFATGMGASDMAAIWAEGATWFRVPETIQIFFEGALSDHAEAKDAALCYLSRLGMDGAIYRALEFRGEAVPDLGMDDRLTICNLAVETGAKAGMFYADGITARYLKERGLEAELQEPEPCRCAGSVDIDLSAISPLVAVPPRVDRVRRVEELQGIPIDQVFVGTCTNGRFSDMERLARGLKGRKVMVRTIVVPASRAVLLASVKAGIVEELLRAGCTIAPPGCGPCLGAHMGVLGEGEVCLSTANRNFTNRMGIGGEVYLASVSTAAASAVKGEIAPPEVLDEA